MKLDPAKIKPVRNVYSAPAMPAVQRKVIELIAAKTMMALGEATSCHAPAGCLDPAATETRIFRVRRSGLTLGGATAPVRYDGKAEWERSALLEAGLSGSRRGLIERAAARKRLCRMLSPLPMLTHPA